MKRNSKSTNVGKHSTLMAAALQDHIAREFGLIHNHTTQPPSNNKGPTQLTLAQKLGLVSSPPPPLTRYQWDKANETSSRRGDSTHPCPICQDVFGLQPQVAINGIFQKIHHYFSNGNLKKLYQLKVPAIKSYFKVLLSCTHTFHKSCLVAFERYSGKKTCPVCRHPTYQTKLINTGAVHHRHTAAIRIQSLWRGYKVRKYFLEYRKTHPPTHPSLRVKYYTQKLTCITSELVDRVTMTTESAENLLVSVDSDLKESRKVLECLGESPYFLNPDWKSINIKATQYISSNCVICLTPLSSPKPLTVLSCSHLYHTTCLHSLESFTNDTALHSCPICRLPYISREYFVKDDDKKEQ